MSRKNWDQVKAERLATSAAAEGYEHARRAFQMGERVRLLREEHGLSQRELAERIGSTQPAIARLEAGGVTPSLGTLEKIAEALDTALVIDFQARKAPAPAIAKRRTRASV
jgi:transcriptional regulator with XRE-family HTH domain